MRILCRFWLGWSFSGGFSEYPQSPVSHVICGCDVYIIIYSVFSTERVACEVKSQLVKLLTNYYFTDGIVKRNLSASLIMVILPLTLSVIEHHIITCLSA